VSVVDCLSVVPSHQDAPPAAAFSVAYFIDFVGKFTFGMPRASVLVGVDPSMADFSIGSGQFEFHEACTLFTTLFHV
jgi:hypothetical protein